MAIEDTNENQNTNSSANTNQTPPPEPNYGQSTGDSGSLFEGLGIETLSGSVDTEGFETFCETMSRLAGHPETTSRVQIKVVPVSSQRLFLPVVAMCVESKQGVVVYSLLIEAMLRRELKPKVEPRRDIPNHHGGEIVIDQPTFRCFDNGLRKIVSAAVAAAFKTTPNRVIHQSHCVIPRHIDLKSGEKCRTFFDSALLALTHAVARDRVGGVTSKHLTNPAGIVNQSTSIEPGKCRLDEVGQPIAADFTTQLELAHKSEARPSLNSDVHTDREAYNLVQVSGYVDFAVVDAQPRPPAMGSMMPTRPSHMAMLHLTSISGLANNGHTIEDLGTQLLGLVSTAAITTKYAWVSFFEKHPGTDSKKTSIGALGLDSDPFMRTPPELQQIDVESVSYGKQPREGALTPKQVVDLWCVDRIAVSLDIVQGGRLQWVQDIFAAAAGIGDNAKRRQLANEAIIAEANKLSNGNFSRIWSEHNNGAIPYVVSSDVVTVHLGTYTDSVSGEVRDIRCLDYLTFLMNWPSDPEYIATATASRIPGMCNAVSLTETRQALAKLGGVDFKITGLATRVFFAPGFITCLIRALIQAGVTFRSEDVLGYGDTGNRAMMNYNLGDSIQADGLYHSGYQGQAAPGVPNNNWYNPLGY